MSGNNGIRLLFFLPGFIFSFTTHAQAEKDTLLNGYRIRYNIFETYGNPVDLQQHRPVLCIGTVKNDTVRTGTWYFFYPSGKLLAKGKYTDGYKSGTWTYYPKQRAPKKIKWEKKNLYKSEIVFDEHNEPVIREVNERGIEFFNGYTRHRYVIFD